MADGSERVQPAVKADYRSAFKSRDFRLYQTARLMVILGAEAQSVAVAWQVYALPPSAEDHSAVLHPAGLLHGGAAVAVDECDGAEGRQDLAHLRGAGGHRFGQGV